jgi:tRNA(Ile)-lysidine synthase
MPPFISLLVTRIEQTIRRRGLFQPDDTLVVALSGGADSTLLLDLLSRLPGFNLRLVVAHLNHCLRGDESDGDQEFCRLAAQRYGLPFELRRSDVACLAAEFQLNLEDAGRRARIEFLDEVRARYCAAAVVLAHHADDQAETVLMRLLRGSGMTGLSGMAYRNDRGYVRPLLEVRRAEIEQYLHEQGMAWREDASNSDTVYLRNRIRHQLLPLLEEYNPAIRESLAATASLLTDDEALLDEMTEQAYGCSCQPGEGRVAIRCGQLRTLHSALQRRVLRHAFKQLTGTREGVSRQHIEAILVLIDSDCPNARLSLPQRVTAVREYDLLLLVRSGDSSLDLDNTSEFLIEDMGSYQLAQGNSLTCNLVNSAVFSTDAHTAYFDLEKTPFPWALRTFRPGDRIMPLGMKGRKKVKDIFIDRKIPLVERRRIPLLFCRDELIWIAGVCTSEAARITDATSVVMRVVWEKDDSQSKYGACCTGSSRG